MFFRNIFGNKNFRKSANIYISEIHKQIIIAPQHINNNNGVRYEQEICSVINYPASNQLLGEELIRNIHLFSPKNKNWKDYQKKDWPAFKHSGLKTLKSFEETYFQIRVIGLNESNIMFSIDAPLNRDNSLSIQSIVSPTAKKELVGERIIKVYMACLAK